MPLLVEEWPTDRLVEYARNPRKNDAQVDRMVSAIREFGFRIPVVAKSDGSVVDGHLRLKAARKLGLVTVPVALADELSDTQIRAFRLLANRSASWAEWDDDLLKLELTDLQDERYDLGLTGFGAEELSGLLDTVEPLLESASGGSGGGAGSLAAKFGVPPFSVLNARDGWWQDRKRAWLSLGIKSEIGRGENVLGLSEQAEEYRTGSGNYAKGRKADAIPGGAGRGSVMRDMGKYQRAQT